MCVVKFIAVFIFCLWKLSQILFVVEVYLVDQLLMDLFSIWARRLSGEAMVSMWKGARCDRETLSCVTPCRSKLGSEGLGPGKFFLQSGVFGLQLFVSLQH